MARRILPAGSSNVTPLRPRKPNPKAEVARSFTSWKLDIIDAMMSDRRVKDGDFRIAFRVMQAVNGETRVAIISDLTICDEVPFTDRFRCNETRKRLALLGWWTVDLGHGGKASRYHFSPANINRVLDQRLIDKEERDRIRAERKSRDRRFKRVVVI
jgi:hypothetical protein